MLKRLKLRNFKSWPEADVKFSRITGLFGKNSSGKSSLMQFLLLLKQTKDSTDRAAPLDLNDGLVQLGTAADSNPCPTTRTAPSALRSISTSARKSASMHRRVGG